MHVDSRSGIGEPWPMGCVSTYMHRERTHIRGLLSPSVTPCRCAHLSAAHLACQFLRNWVDKCRRFFGRFWNRAGRMADALFDITWHPWDLLRMPRGLLLLAPASTAMLVHISTTRQPAFLGEQVELCRSLPHHDRDLYATQGRKVAPSLSTYWYSSFGQSVMRNTQM